MGTRPMDPLSLFVEFFRVWPSIFGYLWVIAWFWAISSSSNWSWTQHLQDPPWSTASTPWFPVQMFPSSHPPGDFLRQTFTFQDDESQDDAWKDSYSHEVWERWWLAIGWCTVYHSLPDKSRCSRDSHCWFRSLQLAVSTFLTPDSVFATLTQYVPPHVMLINSHLGTFQ